MAKNNDLNQYVNMNLGILEDDVSRLVYLSQVYYNISGDYSHIGKMIRSLWFDYPDQFASEDFRKALKRCESEIEKMIPVPRFTVDNGYMFFDPSIVTLGDDEVFCDCGALEMATSLEFVYRVNDHFNKICAFEPDPVCNEMCRANLSMFSKEVRDRVFIYDIGLDEINGTRPFEISNIPGNSRTTESGVPGTSNTAEENIERITVKKLDDILECQDISFLKIHTEGSEFSVIKGACELIKRNKPTIAVSLYHNLKELINVPLLLHGLVPEYRFFMRHYSSGTSESVLYAVRNEN